MLNGSVTSKVNDRIYIIVDNLVIFYCVINKQCGQATISHISYSPSHTDTTYLQYVNMANKHTFNLPRVCFIYIMFKYM